MKRTTIIVQFIQKGILLLKDKYLQEYPLDNVDNYKVINKELFIKELNYILKKNKINTSLLTDNINIIIDNTYSKLDKEILESIFTELSFNKIKFINITKIFDIKKQELIIDISKNNIKIYYLNDVIEERIYFDKYLQILSILLKNIINIHNIKVIKIFGNYCNDKKILSMIERNTNAEVYTYSHPNQVPINLLT